MHKVVLALVVSLLFTSVGPARQTAACGRTQLFAGRKRRTTSLVPRGAQLKYSFKLTNIYKVRSISRSRASRAAA